MSAGTVRLGDLAAAIKSANAGASWLTFDICFADVRSYHWVIDSGRISAALFAQLYQVTASDVAIYHYDPARSIKVTIPRGMVTGGVEETDFDGVQQFAPLLDVEIPALGS